jgi:hypothetical protein
VPTSSSWAYCGAWIAGDHLGSWLIFCSAASGWECAVPGSRASSSSRRSPGRHRERLDKTRPHAILAFCRSGPGTLEEVGRAPKTPTFLDLLGVRGRLKHQNHERAPPRVLDSKPTSYSAPARIVGGGTMSKRNLVIEEGSVEAIARLQKQDEEFCRRLRAAIETGRECCPTMVLTEPCTRRPVSNYVRPY